ncbi:MAG: hypothetical protein NWQ54_05340 [Paraglaciecola sp.]|uniref:hypothetical protein n=1 Tax=Paraglaciecola sp. TaxID=1920173 RepID=UPI00273F26D5|nr:hypothetical protein [Paraglaciecola sp.]MDP5030636.1 hypothetical protein [Paraglaciecola sp.]MDP5040616.1 hypothetical protein [Paraglaciecola sp.]MDP5130284.1 hypothetical protein [Paraglaciecola sp.]
MDISQHHLRLLLKNTDTAFELLKEHPQSQECALNYEQAKFELDNYLVDMRLSLGNKIKHR